MPVFFDIFALFRLCLNEAARVKNGKREILMPQTIGEASLLLRQGFHAVFCAVFGF